MVVTVTGRAEEIRAAAECAAEQIERQLLALIEMFEQGRLGTVEEEEVPEAQPENKLIVLRWGSPCTRQLPEGHRIPWYTSGFQ